MIFVSLTTDWLKYKIVIVLQALCGICIYTLLSLYTSLTSLIVSILICYFFLDIKYLYSNFKYYTFM